MKCMTTVKPGGARGSHPTQGAASSSVLYKPLIGKIRRGLHLHSNEEIVTITAHAGQQASMRVECIKYENYLMDMLEIIFEV